MGKNKPTNRSRTPQGKAFMNFIGSNWAESSTPAPEQWEVAPFAAQRRARLAQAFPGKVILIEAGGMQTRANDTEYRYRPSTDFTYLTGWGSATVPDSVLIIDTRAKKPTERLYLRPTAGKGTDEFFANPAIGEFWVGPRPTLSDIQSQLGVRTYDLAKLDQHLSDWPKPLTLKNNR